jgi:hypothetical protein
MEPGPRPEEPAEPTPAAWPPQRLDSLLLPDARFARAYNALGDRRRALLKRAIAAQFALNPPRRTLRAESREVLPSGLARTSIDTPRPFVLLLCDAGLDAPALLLAALLPAFSGRPDHVLVARLGNRADVPDSLLAACELAGQESVAALGPRQMERLLIAAAQTGLPGLVLHQDSAALRRMLAATSVRAALDASPLTLVPLALPQRPGLWRDAPGQLPPADVALLYGALPFEAGSAADADFSAFAAGRDLLLLPDGRAGQGDAACVVCASQLGLFRWPRLSPDLFSLRRCTYSSAP